MMTIQNYLAISLLGLLHIGVLTTFALNTKTFCGESTSPKVCDELKCQVNQMAIEFGGQIIPGCVRGQRFECDLQVNRIVEALGMNKKCSSNQNGGYSYKVSKLGNQNHFIRASGSVSPEPNTLFVHPTMGSDTNSGANRASPLKSIQRAILKFRADSQKPGTMRTIVLMAGKHRLTKPLVLIPNDSFLTFQGETGAILTGSISLEGLRWRRSSNSESIIVADIPPDILTNLGPLSVLSDGKSTLAIRAQHPNKKTFLQHAFMSKSTVDRWLHQTPKKASSFQKQISVPVTGELTRYKLFSYASNGSCNGVFTPPTGYFCHPQADADGSCRYDIPSGMKLEPKGTNAIKLKQWQDQSTAYVHALHPLKWGGWSFRVGNRNHPKCRGTPKQSLCFVEGGFQEARGDCGRGGGEWYVENVRELLDSPGEFFVDLKRAKLFYYPPKEAIFDPNELELGSQVTKLIEVRGDSNTPVRNVRFFNIEFSRTYPTHMEPHETPSGGDWSVHRGAALFLEGVSDVIVADCKFTLLGSNGLFVSKFARNIRIFRNEFYALDGTGILMVGDPRYHDSRPWDRTSDEDYVSDIVVSNNIISDVGLRELQAAGIFGSISTNVLLQNNVIFNGPRAGIVFNDLFAGNINTIGNLLFNVVRLTRDHGPYNIWDRQKWLLPTREAWTNANTVKGNFIIGNEWGPKLVDLDDGARNHVVANNVLAYGNMKFKGYNHTASHNVVIAALPNQVACVEISISDLDDSPKYEWTRNICYAASAQIMPYQMRGAVYCGSKQFFTRENTYSGFPKVTSIDSCGSLTKWQQKNGQDVDTAFDSHFASVDTIISVSKKLLGDFL